MRFVMLTVFVVSAAIASTLAHAQDEKLGGQVGEMSMTSQDVGLFKGEHFSPYAGRKFPNRPLWGDTHLHTSNSLDARAFGVTLDPEQSYRFARGEEVTTSHGLKVRLSRPLDWLVVSDHSDGLGAMNEIIAGNVSLMRNAKLRDWNERLNKGGDTALNATMEVIESFAGVSDIKMPAAALELPPLGGPT